MSYEGQPPYEPPPGYQQAPPGYGQPPQWGQQQQQWGQQQQPGYQQAPPQWGAGPQFQSPQPPRKRSWPRRHPIITGLVGAFALIIVISIAAGASSPTTPASGSSASQAQAPIATTPPSPAPAATTAPPAPSYTPAEQQAIDAAEGYLSDGQGFSKVGLIQQLSSADGNGFSMKLAKFAVGHVKVNWWHEAVIAAKGYMTDGEGFSYSSLVDQLDSPYGSQFTVAQAEYAAKKVGL